MSKDRGEALIARGDTELLADIEPDEYDPIDAARRFVEGVKRWLGRPAT